MGKKTVKVPEEVDLFENGGLDDEDADAAHPGPALEPKPFIRFAPKDRERIDEYHERDPRRRNNVCDNVTCSIFTPNSLLQRAAIIRLAAVRFGTFRTMFEPEPKQMFEVRFSQTVEPEPE